MNYEQTLHYLYNKLPLFSNLGKKAYKADLTNTIALCNYLGNPENKIRTIHVAGTNGKGSVSHMLSSIFQESGYRTGLYTSPHLKDFRERIRVNGRMISKEFVIDFTEKMAGIATTLQPSFFELTFVMALSYFEREKVDIAIIETGLGGRLDSTNVIYPEISLITNIGYDHMDILGDTLEKIAREKAGIIKACTPVVIGEWLEETRPVFESTARTLNAPIVFAEDKYEARLTGKPGKLLEIVLEEKETHEVTRYELDLTGHYQLKNLRTVISAIGILKEKFRLEPSKIATALKQVKDLSQLHGRWEVISEKPQVVLDVAHNRDGMTQVVSQLQEISCRQLRIVFGMVKDKEIEQVLEILPTQAVYYFTKASIPRALPEIDLMERAARFQLKGKAYPQVTLAVDAALRDASPDDLIVVCGSVFVVGEVALPERISA
ncbi:MAG: bifunctional folylpolyglutamate synthase/dihydrofolate synthase [Bacteroidota bacterium]|nr:bifunctional folylpolyglutamate synthase/dihydrofolate synthase [Bacteroidota bacterium]